MVSGIKFKIFVIDNDSRDGTVAMIHREFSEVVLFRNNSNLGFGRANNVVLRSVNAKYVFFLNPDTRLLNDAVTIFFKFMEDVRNSEVACCGAHIVDRNKVPRSAFGNFPSLAQVFFEFGFKHIFRTYYREHLSVSLPNFSQAVKSVDYITGAAFFAKKSALARAGFFDEDFFLYYEETELFFRLQKLGYKSVVNPAAIILHHVGQSSDPLSPVMLRLSEESKYLFFEKCYGRATRRLVQFLYFVKYLVLVACKSRDADLQRFYAALKFSR
jgi:GT2 family glycosyltransferase